MCKTGGGGGDVVKGFTANQTCFARHARRDTTSMAALAHRIYVGACCWCLLLCSESLAGLC